ncbi:hypothetical protein BURPS406E_O0102 [Burkholderia pseudomallei 406e]|uniref:Uncharacterized protein n=2 Tax=Burkholderia pseudomallei TaxID=28450 RepID=A0A0E1VY42_BURPE|nr:hypothetical protein BURPS668_A0708 [Burkholderia pseudomallei 668]ABN94968.1 hypothetical protein BURPS1106A_A0616 [Burkholderia pseudomallei 1106a]AFR18595.1 hypothetical protein BPC006_II0663 [Burkholderia pseudomallei BPC006]EBA45802.1 hypothetical protein BURPS305_7830 [Burkholderia pseudomallei 305]EDO83900.1 hypothetical protein BURPS406E_O0102 [Burkholderia pseudomallei 406e]EDO90612.1 hypothetical protein BURPSPAST_D0419 [Burkholderia pseudomallei Pasteur 52237]EDS88410.1 hypothet
MDRHDRPRVTWRARRGSTARNGSVRRARASRALSLYLALPS